MFRVIYELRNSASKRAVEPDRIETLFDAIDAYCPDADLAVCVGDRRIPLDICRDMYGFFENLLDVMYAVAFDLPCDTVGYPDVLTPDKAGQRSYGIMLTEQQAPLCSCSSPTTIWSIFRPGVSLPRALWRARMTSPCRWWCPSVR